MSDKIRKNIKKFIGDKIVILSGIVGLVLWMIIFGMVYVIIFPEHIALHLDFSRRIDWIGGAAEVWWLIFILALFFALNCFLSFFLYYRYRLLSYILLFGSLIVMITGFFTVYRIISLN